MAVENLPVKINSFTGGLLTEAGPLNFPENASLDEQNFIIERTGLRRRRLGFDYEEGYSLIQPEFTSQFDNKSYTSFNWKNVAGDSEKEFVVIQIGASLMFFDILISPLSSGLVKTIDIGDKGKIVDISSIDGRLVVARDTSTILIVEYKDEDFVTSEEVIKVRDFFGVEDEFEGNDLLSEGYSEVRPGTLEDTHLYNLRNQSWGRSRASSNREGDDRYFGEDVGVERTVRSSDPILAFKQYTLRVPQNPRGIYPSNGDSVAKGMIDDTEFNPPEYKFFPSELGSSPLLTQGAPKGFFIIDLLRRGQSRVSEYDRMFSNSKSKLRLNLRQPLPEDYTKGGATCVEEYAGRLWYGGFSGEVVGGDRRSPTLSSYVAFSQLVRETSQITKCYQSNDPTFEQEADLLDTDGGLIRVNGAYGIKRLVSVSDGLLVIASNGIWVIRGDQGSGFSASGYEVSKINDQGCLGANSVVVVGNQVLYWGENSIYTIYREELGEYSAKDLSLETIKTFFKDIPVEQIKTCEGVYDRFDNKVRWLYRDLQVGSICKELIFDVTLGSFYPSVIKSPNLNSPIALSPVLVPPFKTGEQEEQVLAGTEQVVSGGENVVVFESIPQTTVREVVYLTLAEEDICSITFSSYRRNDWVDWKSFNGSGIDADAFILTGYDPSGEIQRRKQIPYISVYLRRTEEGFSVKGDNIAVTNPSSCLMQGQWNWTNSANSGRWSKTSQVYRYRRHYFPQDVNDSFDTGDSLIVTKNKLRGNGKTLSLLFKTEPGKNCELWGWSYILGVSKNV